MKIIYVKMNFLAILFLCFTASIHAQSKMIDRINSVELKDMGAIKDEKGVVGYYFFYEVDKIDRKTRVFELKILDANLEEIVNKKIKSGKKTSLIEAKFNGSAIMLKFMEKKGRTKMYKFKTYALDGDEGKTITRKLSKKEYKPPFYINSKRGINHGNALFPIPGKGFVQYAAVKNKKWGYIIDYLGEENSWAYKSEKTSKMLEYTQYIAADEDLLLSSLSKFKNSWGKGQHNSILAIDVNTGEKIFENVLHKTKPISILNGFIDRANNEIVVFGIYYKDKAKTHKAKSKGIYISSLDLQGNVKQEKFLSWEKGAKRFMKRDKKGKNRKGRYLTFHDIVRTKDGKIIALGEQFRKQIDGAAIVGSFLSGGNSKLNASKLMIENFVAIQLNSDLKVEKVKIFKKKKSTAKVLGMGFESPQLMAYLAKAQGAFDYAFTQQNEDHSVTSFGYIFWERRKGEKNGYSFGVINYADGKFSTDKIKLKGKASVIKILPGPVGYILVVEYQKKKKKLDMRLEKINL